MAAAETTTLVDAGACDWCGHGQWTHKLGKRGCKDPECGCAKYEPPKDAPAEPVLEGDPASPVPGELVDGPAVLGPLECVGGPEPARPGDVERPPTEPGPTRAELVADLTAQSIELGTYDLVVPAGVRTASTCAYPAGEDQGEHDHAMCEDVVAERAELAAATASPSAEADRTGQVIPDVGQAIAADIAADQDEIRRLRIWLTRTQAERDQAREQVTELTEELASAHAWLDAANAQRDKATGQAEEAQRRADALAGELRSLEVETTAVTGQRDQAVADLERIGAELIGARREAKAAIRARDRARAELDAATLARLRLQEDLDGAVHAGLAAATAVLWRYPAWQCETCGSRYSQRTKHEHPLTAVDVLIVRREVAG